MLVEERLERLQDEQRGAAVSLPVRGGLDYVVGCYRLAHGPESYSDRNLLCAEVSQTTMPRFRVLTSLLLCLMAVALADAAPSLASHGQTTYFEGATQLLEGSTRAETFQRLQALGVKALQGRALLVLGRPDSRKRHQARLRRDEPRLI